MPKELRCGDIITGCDEVIRGETEEEVLAKGAKHALEDHGIADMDEDTLEKVKEAIRDA